MPSIPSNFPLPIANFNKKLNEYCSIQTKVVGKRPIHMLIREYAKHQHQIIDLINKIDLPDLLQLKKINNQINQISIAKCIYYDTTKFGFLKRIYSCFLNAVFFGKCMSSGQLGLSLSEQLSIQIENREQVLQKSLLEKRD